MNNFDILLVTIEVGCVVAYAIWLAYKNRKAEKEFNKRWENYDI